MRLSDWVCREAAKDFSKIDDIKEQIESMDSAIEQLQRRMETLTENMEPEQAEPVRTSIQRRIDAVNEDKRELQTALQKMIMEKCGKPGKKRG